MIVPIISTLIGIAATELIYFKVIRKKIVKNTFLAGVDYTFRDFLIEKGLSMLGGLLLGVLAFRTIIDFQQTVYFIRLVVEKVSMPVLILSFLILMITVNWYFHKKLEEKEETNYTIEKKENKGHRRRRHKKRR